MNKIARVALIVFIAIIVVSILFALFMFIAFGGLTFLVYVPKPEITYGEFPIKLTYELDGEIIVIEDIVVCEFDGFINRGTAGKARKWNTKLKSGEELILLDLRDLNQENELGQTMVELYFYYGTGAYYMGDTDNPFAREAQSFDWIDYKYKTKDGKIGYSGYKAEEAFEKYKIRVISWECAPPIKNEFR